MGHVVNLRSYEESVSKEVIMEELDEEAIYESDSRSGLPNSIRWLTPVLNSYEEAEQYIEKNDRQWYDQLAVRYKYIPIAKPSKTYKTLETKLDEAYKKYREADNLVAFKDFKSEYVGCKHCGSKLNTKYMKSNKCPLCHAEMRPQSTLDKIKHLHDKCQELEKKLKEEEDKLRTKNAKNAEIYWLVKYEYHV